MNHHSHLFTYPKSITSSCTTTFPVIQTFLFLLNHILLIFDNPSSPFTYPHLPTNPQTITKVISNRRILRTLWFRRQLIIKILLRLNLPRLSSTYLSICTYTIPITLWIISTKMLVVLFIVVICCPFLEDRNNQLIGVKKL